MNHHPEAELEKKHLEETLSIVMLESEIAAKELLEQQNKLRSLHAGDERSELIMRELMLRSAQERVSNLERSAQRTYFTRVDFIPNDTAEQATYYIGKWGVLQTQSLTPVVIDWRSPVANLYYSGQIGPMDYTAPDGTVQGELLLKRQFTIENGELHAIFDTDLVSQDDYLQDVLGAITSDKLREIVTTIQAEQNIVIRHTPKSSLVVQGVAGSGKTTIALHRIAYLLYTYSETLQADQMMILAPNPLFLDYISGVLPELGVEHVRQTTMDGFTSSLLGKFMPKVVSGGASAFVQLSKDDQKNMETVCRLKGSLAFGQDLQAYLASMQEAMIPSGDVKFGPVVLYTEEQMRTFFLHDLKPLALRERLSEIQKHMTKRIKTATKQVIELLMVECDRRVEKLKIQMGPSDERREKILHLYNSRDAQLEEVKKAAIPFARTYIARFGKFSPLECYAAFLQHATGEEYEQACNITLPLLKKKQATPEDLAPLLIVSACTEGIARLPIRHIVIDEAQDFSPLELYILKMLTSRASFTLVGDLMQGALSYRGLKDWQEAMDVLEDATRHELVTSYRSTMEIMHFAACIANTHPFIGQKPSNSVLRHGPVPEVYCAPDEKCKLQKIHSWIAHLQEEGFHSIALIEKTPAQAKALCKLLPEAMLLDPFEQNYTGGVLVCAVTDSKGLEFDAVILCDISRKNYDDNQLDARLLYIGATRPLHRLMACVVGEISPLVHAFMLEKPLQ